MSGITAAASVLITLALIFHSLGVLAEQFARYLKSWHVVAFWTGFDWASSPTSGGCSWGWPG